MLMESLDCRQTISAAAGVIDVVCGLALSYKLRLFFLFKFLNGLGPLYLAFLLTPCVSSRSLRYVDQLLLCVLKTRLKNREGSSFVSHSSWTVQWVNSHVNEVFTPTLHIFEICLKTNFLKFQNWFCKRAFLWFLWQPHTWKASVEQQSKSFNYM